LLVSSDRGVENVTNVTAYRESSPAGPQRGGRILNATTPCVHTPAHEIIYVLCYGNRMGPEYALGARLTAGIRRRPRRAHLTPQHRVAPTLRSARAARKVVLQRLKPERSCAGCVVAEATTYKASRVATRLAARLHSTRYKRTVKKQRDSRNLSRMSGLSFSTRCKLTFPLDTNRDFFQPACLS
jgi:hypothetical protein